jgi:hypothetical protein
LEDEEQELEDEEQDPEDKEQDSEDDQQDLEDVELPEEQPEEQQQPGVGRKQTDLAGRFAGRGALASWNVHPRAQHPDLLIFVGGTVRKQCPQLKGSTCLRLSSCTAGGHSMDAALDTLLGHMPLLADLTVLSTFDCEEMPECVVELRALTRLCWRHNGLKGLPSGPYLSGK